MNYEGRLYGKVGKRYIELAVGTEYVDKLRNELVVIDSLVVDFPQNKPLYKDSGLWQLRTDDMEDVLVQQDVNESFRSFLIRCNEINVKEESK